MTRKQLALLLAIAAALVGFVLLAVRARSLSPSKARAENLSIVSLSPGITETLFAIGAGPNVIAISNFCSYPPEAMKLPRVGTSITPDYEAIARLDPTLIVSENAAGTRRNEIGELSQALFLPWLSLEDLTSSIRVLGTRVERQPEAEKLAHALTARLSVPEPTHGPRVLLVLAETPGKLEEIWFIRKNSLHGAALRAAGGRNAVPETVSGLPRLSLARLIELDPDLILLLVIPTKQPIPAARYLADFERLEPLTAVKTGRIAVLDAPDALVQGPRILAFADRLEREIKRLQEK